MMKVGWTHCGSMKCPIRASNTRGKVIGLDTSILLSLQISNNEGMFLSIHNHIKLYKRSFKSGRGPNWRLSSSVTSIRLYEGVKSISLPSIIIDGLLFNFIQISSHHHNIEESLCNNCSVLVIQSV